MEEGVSETSRGAVAAPEFLLLGHQPQNWPLDGMTIPSEKTSLTLLWNPHVWGFSGRWPQRAPSQELAFQVTPLYSHLYRQWRPT